MDDEAAIAIADAQLACRGLPHSDVRDGVVFRPARRIVEVAFSANDEFKEDRGFDLRFRVFLEAMGSYWCVGALLDDGTPAECVPYIAAAEPIAAATEYMQSHRVFDVGLVPTILEQTDLFEVYYGPLRDNVMGGDYHVYMLDSGIVIRVVRGQ